MVVHHPTLTPPLAQAPTTHPLLATRAVVVVVHHRLPVTPPALLLVTPTPAHPRRVHPTPPVVVRQHLSTRIRPLTVAP